MFNLVMDEKATQSFAGDSLPTSCLCSQLLPLPPSRISCLFYSPVLAWCAPGVGFSYICCLLSFFALVQAFLVTHLSYDYTFNYSSYFGGHCSLNMFWIRCPYNDTFAIFAATQNPICSLRNRDFLFRKNCHLLQAPFHLQFLSTVSV